jgi:CRP-like cAMP-binding protein
VPGRSNIATDLDTLTTRDWNVLLTNAQQLKFEKDSVVVSSREQVVHLYRVKKGKFRVEKKDKSRTFVLNTLRPGDIYGPMLVGKFYSIV